LQKAHCLTQAKEYRNRIDDSLEFIVTAKNEKAFQRAKQNLQFKQDKLRITFSKGTEVKERRIMLEQERRKHVLASMENRLSSAASRANNLVQKRKGRVRYNKRRMQAIERRKEVDDNRQSILNVRYEKALLRAKNSLQCKQDKLRDMFSKASMVKEKRTLIEQKRRKRVLFAIESRRNSAQTRAEHLVQMKQGRAGYDKRRRLVRVSLEDRRRSHLLSIIDRTERATRNLNMRLRDRQYKARESIEHAVCVSKRVKAVRLLQKVVRSKLGLGGSGSMRIDLTQSREHAAANCLQNFWKTYIVLKCMKNDTKVPSPMKSLLLILEDMDISSTKELPSEQCFKQLTMKMAQTSILNSAHVFLDAFGPLLQCGSSSKVKSRVLSDRILLSAFLIMHYPDEVLGEKRGADICSNMLEKASKTMTHQLQGFADLVAYSEEISIKSIYVAIKDLVARIVCYGTLFHIWRNADSNKLISHMITSAEQSWVAYLISKESLSYINEHMLVLSEKDNGGILFQHRMHHESTKKGAYKLIQSIRTAFKKLVGREEAARTIKKAKQTAIQKIKTEHTMKPIKADIDSKILAANTAQSLPIAKFAEKEGSCMNSDKEFEIISNTEELPEHLFSNADLVHKILLNGSGEVESFLNKVSNGFYKSNIFDSANNFMAYWHRRRTNLSSIDHEMSNSMSIQNSTAMTMECAYFDKVEHELMINKDLKGVKELILNLFHKTRQLIPNRHDLHNIISDDDVLECRAVAEFLMLLIKVSRIMSSYLEAPNRSSSTVEWEENARSYINVTAEVDSIIPYEFENPDAFLVASISFLLKKVDLCHLDKMNFELIKAVPLINQIGVEYEQKNFQARYGQFSSFRSMRELSATWGWIQRSQQALKISPDMIRTLKTDCFVDELLFVQESIPLPEILSLDGDLIEKVRTCAKTAVVGSALLLHACNIAEIPTCQIESLTSQGQCQMNKLMSLLHNTPSEHSLLDAFIKFIEAIKRKDVEHEAQASHKSLVKSICDGNDAVSKLLNIRVRQLFKFACTLDTSAANIPLAMKTGIANNEANCGEMEEQCAIEIDFISRCKKKAKKLGFSMFSEDLMKATYEAYKAINHSLCLYKEDIMLPTLNEIVSMESEE